MKTSGPRSWVSRRRPEDLGFALFLLIVVLPVAGSLLYALLYTVGAAGLLSRGLTGAHWAAVLGGAEVWSSFGLSVAVAGAATLLAAAGGLAVALALPRQMARGPLSYALYLPLALPWTVAGLLAFQLLSPGGLLSRLAFRAGLTAGIAGFPELVNDRWAVGIVATHAALALPFFALLFSELAASGRLAEYQALSRSLGATRGQTLARVALPLLLRGARGNLLLVFVAVLGSYEIPLLLGRQTPQMLSVLTERKFQRFDILEKPEAFAVAVLYSLFALAVLALALCRRPAEERA